MANSIRTILATVVVALSLAAPVLGADPLTEDPVAMAAQYTKQAAELRASASNHAKQAKFHRVGMGGSSKMSHESFAVHCDNIAASLNAAAAESEALAAAYKKLAAEKSATK